MKRIFYRIFFALIIFLEAYNCNAQISISQNLYNALPDSVKPKNRTNITDDEAGKILIYGINQQMLEVKEIVTIDSLLKNKVTSIENRATKINVAYATTIYSFNRLMNDSITNVYDSILLSAIGNNPAEFEKQALNAHIIKADEKFVDEGKYEKAIEEIQAALQLAPKIKDKKIIANAYIVLNHLYETIYLFPEAIENLNIATYYSDTGSTIYKKSYFAYLPLKKAELFLTSYLYQNDDNKNHWDIDSAKLLLSHLRHNNALSGRWLSEWFVNEGLLNYVEGKYQSALLYADSANKVQFEGKDIVQLKSPRCNLKGLVLAKLGRFKEAENILENNQSQYFLKKYALETLYTSSYQEKDYAHAYKYMKMYVDFLSQENSLINIGIVFSANQKYRVAEEEKDIAQLKQRNRLYVFIAAIILTALFVAFLFYQRFRRLKAARKEAEHVQKLKDLEGILVKQELDMRASKDKLVSERKHIGRVLHDGLSGSLASLKFLVSDYKKQTSNEPDKEKLQTIEDEVASIYQESREYSHRLAQAQDMETTQENFDVLKYIDGIQEQFNTLGVLKIFVTKSDSWQQLTTAQSRYVFYILKECFSNAVKHARANNIWISLLKENNDFILQFKDDGIGITENTDNGIGLANLKNYITHLNGKMQSDTMQGVSYTFAFPL